MPEGLPRPRTLLLIAAVFVWFGTSVETKQSPYTQRIIQNPKVLLTSPWVGVMALVARNGDDRLYFNYAQLMLGQAPDLDHLSKKEQGDPAQARERLVRAITPDGTPRLPYRDFPVEYPPVPLLLMLLPRFFADTYPAYRIAFTAFTAGLFFLAAWLAARLVAVTAPVPATPSVETVWRRATWLLLATGPLLCQRFDVLPAVLVAGGLAALAHRRDALAGVALGFAIMTKLYPLLLCLPLGALFLGAGQRKRVLVVAGSSAATVVAIALPFLVAAPQAFLRSNALYGARPFHFESTWGGVLLALGGGDVVTSSFGSRNVISPAWLLTLASVVLFGGLLALAAAAFKHGRVLAQASLAIQTNATIVWALGTLLFVLSTSKVLSPQFFIWLLPLTAVLPGAPGKRLFLAAVGASGLTQIFYPALYGLATEGHPAGVLVLLLRNVFLVGLTVIVIRFARRQMLAGPVTT